MVNSIGDFLKSTFPSLINKSGEIFRALLADNKTGTIEKIFLEVEAERKNWLVKNVYEQKDEQLDKTFDALSVLERINTEQDEKYKERQEVLFYRAGDTVWGTGWNIRNAFRLFVKHNNVWIINNTNTTENNLLLNGDFERLEGWELKSAEYTKEARFNADRGLTLTDGFCQQKMEVLKNRTYFLHFFIVGTIGVEIENNGLYWNKQKESWTSNLVINNYASTQWDAKDIYFYTEKNTTVNIKFIGNGFLDYARLFLKSIVLRFTVIIQFVNTGNEGTLKSFLLAHGQNDPVSDCDYANVTYIGQAIVDGGVSTQPISIYEELLDIMKPAGIDGVIEILKRS